MTKDTKIIILAILLLAIILIAVGYAGITNITLSINGTASAEGSTENFKVIFTGTPTSSGKGTATGTINASDPTKATINVSGLATKGDTAIVTYTIKNDSQDLSAILGNPNITVGNLEDFEVTTSYGSTQTLAKGEETTLAVTVKMLTTPIDETPITTIIIELDASPAQP